MELNEDLLTDQILHLGTRVAVDTLEVHVKALYTLMKMPISSLLPRMRGRGERDKDRDQEIDRERARVY